MADFWVNKPVLVTGATGLLGSYMVRDLVEAGADVVALVRDLVPTSNFYRMGLDSKVKIVRGGLEEYEVVERAFNEYEIQACFHLGAQTIVGTANRSPLSTFNSNIKGTWNVLEAARNSTLLEAMVVASSDKAYGTHEKLPYKESMCLKGEHPYDVSKSCCDLLSQSYHKTYGVPLAITRCGNLYGGGDLNFNRIIPGTMRSVIFGEAPIIRSDGSPVRDYFYVLDASKAYIMLAENIKRKDVVGQAFNFGNEKHMSVSELTNKILEILGRTDLEPKVLDESRNEIINQYLSCAKARNILSFEPEHSFEETISETYGWYREYFKDVA